MTQFAAPPAVSKNTSLPPAIVLGGEANALSIARSLGHMGVKVWAINQPSARIRFSRFARWIRLAQNDHPEKAWPEFLLDDEAKHLHGGVLLAGNDDAIEVIRLHREALSEHYLLDLSNDHAQLQMLDKRSTYEAAREAGVATPRFWTVQTLEEIESLRRELVFPLLVKPLLSHEFAASFAGTKFFIANDFDQLESAIRQVEHADLDVMLVEHIPGGDDRLCSYYTYIDEDGNHLFQFTKRIIRRFPIGMGNACYHVTDHIPELREPAERLFTHVGLRGLANVEFKLDPRDDMLKLIECNARFTAANVLLARCGYDLARLVYSRLVGLNQPTFGDYPKNVRLWHPIDDFRAFLTLRKRGELSFGEWLRDILRRRKTAPFFRWTDPLPALCGELIRVQKKLRKN